ncbi:hypothetical protein KUG88_27655 [Rhodococcus rhodochrous]|uniref:hypothetical protein n=1 Tax=Rhodococcus rhodochrous TaxID=1829 RepID=UPI001E38AEAF|nr:hypothetical protein [Rhodococcus rhodochrous]MCB8913885.1 hypothetical protein [Rhodococcus rhodochrous]
MSERDPIPVGDDGIDVHAILDGRLSPPTHGYAVEVAGRPVTVWVDYRFVDDDGTFIPAHRNRMVRFHIFGTALRPLEAVHVVRSTAPVSLGPLYLYAPDRDRADRRFEVAVFFSAEDTQVDAPPDFDWQKRASRHPGSYIVYRSTVESDRLVEEYRSLNNRFYQPHMDHRGTYWDLRLQPPPEDSGLGASFAAAQAALSRKGVIRDDLRPLALEWVRETTVAFTFLRTRFRRCYRLEMQFPTDEQMRVGRFFLPGGMMDIREPDQFAAGLVSMLFERAAASLALGGSECVCPL